MDDIHLLLEQNARLKHSKFHQSWAPLASENLGRQATVLLQHPTVVDFCFIRQDQITFDSNL